MIVERLSDQMWIEIITPERAAELLKLNYNNRNMRPNHVARIAEKTCHRARSHSPAIRFATTTTVCRMVSTD